MYKELSVSEKLMYDRVLVPHGYLSTTRYVASKKKATMKTSRILRKWNYHIKNKTNRIASYLTQYTKTN